MLMLMLMLQMVAEHDLHLHFDLDLVLALVYFRELTYPHPHLVQKHLRQQPLQLKTNEATVKFNFVITYFRLFPRLLTKYHRQQIHRNYNL